MPKNKADLLHHSDADIKTLVGHFSNVLPEETTELSVLDQWLDLNLLISQPTQRASKLQELLYSSLLANKTDNLKSILSIVEVMTVLSVSTAACERSFSAMNRIKTNLRTYMRQETLQDLLVISTTKDSMMSFVSKKQSATG